jgi:hypothetical protein
MKQYMDYDQHRCDNGEEIYLREQKWSSEARGEKIFEISVTRGQGQRIVAIGISLIVWCLFAFTIFIAYGVANVSPSPAAHTTQILLILGLFFFSFFVLWTNILLNKLLSKKR